MIKISPFSLVELRKKGAIILPYQFSSKYFFTVIAQRDLIAEFEELVEKHGYKVIKRFDVYKASIHAGSDCMDFDVVKK